MATYTNETGLVHAITAAVKKAFPNAWIMKVHGGAMQVPGIPDLLIVVDGLMIAAEAKHQKAGESHQHAIGRATPAQVRQIGKLREAGAIAGVVTSPEETLDLIRQAMDQQMERWQ